MLSFKTYLYIQIIVILICLNITKVDIWDSNDRKGTCICIDSRFPVKNWMMIIVHPKPDFYMGYNYNSKWYRFRFI